MRISTEDLYLCDLCGVVGYNGYRGYILNTEDHRGTVLARREGNKFIDIFTNTSYEYKSGYYSNVTVYNCNTLITNASFISEKVAIEILKAHNTTFFEIEKESGFSFKKIFRG